MKISSLHLYPVKSLGGQTLDTARALGRGLADDRRWMLVDADGRFISQREHAGLALWTAELRDEDLRLRHHNGQLSLRVPAARAEDGPPITVTVWDDTFTARLVPTVTPTELSAALGIDCRLVYLGADSHRPIDPRYAGPEEEVSFADGFPYLIANTASLRELERRMGTELSMSRFRPNIVVHTDTAFAEDEWREVAVGETGRFRTPKPCGRCVVVTIDPRTGEKNPDVLAELARFRRRGRKILFGVNACLEGEPVTLRVGDPVRVVTADSAPNPSRL